MDEASRRIVSHYAVAWHFAKFWCAALRHTEACDHPNVYRQNLRYGEARHVVWMMSEKD